MCFLSEITSAPRLKEVMDDTTTETMINTTLQMTLNITGNITGNTTGGPDDAWNDTAIEHQSERSTALIFLMYIVIEVVMTLVICTGNALVIAAVIRFRELRTPTYMLICFLSISDLLVGMSLPYHIVLFLKPELMSRFGFCMTRIMAVCFPGVASVLFLLGKCKTNPYHSNSYLSDGTLFDTCHTLVIFTSKQYFR